MLNEGRALFPGKENDRAFGEWADGVDVGQVGHHGLEVHPKERQAAMWAYAKQAKNKQLEVHAAEIRIRAERRIGELMAAQRDAGMMAPAGRPAEKIGFQNNPISDRPTLSEAGIDKNLADRARKLASIPEDEFNGIVS